MPKKALKAKAIKTKKKTILDDIIITNDYKLNNNPSNSNSNLLNSSSSLSSDKNSNDFS